MNLAHPAPSPAAPRSRPALADARFVLATDLDGTFLGGDAAQRRALYDWIESRRDDTLLVFVTGRDLPHVARLVEGGLPAPDYVIGDVGTTVVDWRSRTPVPALIDWVEGRWGGANERVRAMLAGTPGLELQTEPMARRVSYYYDPEVFDPASVAHVEAAGFDVVTSADTYLDVLPRGVSKGPTLERFCEALGIPRDRVLVAGDTLNDWTLYLTGLDGVVVGNAEPALVERVTGLAEREHVYLSPHPGCAGIADAIHHFAKHPEAPPRPS